jgi:type I restriction enzyme M protein
VETLIDRAITDGHLRIEGSGKAERIVYVAVSRSERWSDPEEKVRAAFYAELIYKYGYKPQRIGVEITVPDRTPKDAADLVIFRDDARTEPYAVIECKRDGVSDAEFAQAIEQAAGNGTWAKFRALYIGVVAGATRRFLDFTAKYGVLEREANIIADLPRAYGKPEEWVYRKAGGDGFSDLRTVNREDLIRAIEKCHQTLWGGGRLSPPTAFGELCKILFIKNVDERTTRKGGFYRFQIKTHEPAKSLGERLRALYKQAQESDPDVFTETIKIDDKTLRTIVSHLQGINLNKTDLDTKGVAFERFMDGFFKGDFGQYFTPREIIAFAVEIVRPTRTQTVLDPACGSGGFLLHALDYVRHQADGEFPDHETDPEEAKEHHSYWNEFARRNLYGIEINDEIARVAKMNMIIHDDGHTNVIGFDALEAFDRFPRDKPAFSPGKFDLILTNPPFGAVVKATEKGESYLEKFELRRFLGKPDVSDLQKGEGLTDSSASAGKRGVKARASVKTEILFIERVWQFLKPGTGQAAIVLPDGILTNSSLQGVRDWMLNRFQIRAVVSLPQAAFAHFGAGVKASLIFVRRRGDSEAPNDDEAIFMAAPENIGYDATGRKTFQVVDIKEEGDWRRELHRCDLYDLEVVKQREVDPTREESWTERSRRVLPGTGILRQFREFEQNPALFFA